MIEVRHWNWGPETVSRDSIFIFEDAESRHKPRQITVADLAVDRRPPEAPSNLHDIIMSFSREHKKCSERVHSVLKTLGEIPLILSIPNLAKHHSAL